MFSGSCIMLYHYPAQLTTLHCIDSCQFSKHRGMIQSGDFHDGLQTWAVDVVKIKRAADHEASQRIGTQSHAVPLNPSSKPHLLQKTDHLIQMPNVFTRPRDSTYPFLHVQKQCLPMCSSHPTLKFSGLTHQTLILTTLPMLYLDFSAEHLLESGINLLENLLCQRYHQRRTKVWA